MGFYVLLWASVDGGTEGWRDGGTRDKGTRDEGRRDERTKGGTDEQREGRTDKGRDGGTDIRRDGWRDGQTDGISVRLEESKRMVGCRIGRVLDWKSVGLEECRIGRV